MNRMDGTNPAMCKTLYKPVFKELALRFEADGTKLKLSNISTGAWIVRAKKAGSLRAGLLPTSTAATSCPFSRRSLSIEMAWVRCPLPSP